LNLSKSLKLALPLLLLLSGCTAPLPEADPEASQSPVSIPTSAIAATVNYVHDGDTLFLATATDTNLKVRLIGLDTPEIGDNAECFGSEATDLLRTLLPEGSEVLAAPDVEPLDRYGRSLLYLFKPDGTFVNLELVRQGAGEALQIGQNGAYFPQLQSAQDAAESESAGMWGAC
jgi:micrococcal nuclease